MAKFNEGIDPTLPLAGYTRKQETCQEFAQDANVPISEELMVTTGTKHALQCGSLTQAWCEWRHLPAGQHTWLNWKSHWTALFNNSMIFHTSLVEQSCPKPMTLWMTHSGHRR